jgi:NADH-quinone oxidoreductase subunit L
MFHLTTHAFFKALLFLGAGSIIHSCHHEQNIFRMGGLWNRMPITFVTFSIGFFALIGFPFLSGFFSKDAILYLAREVGGPAFWILAFGALLTALYMTRLWIIVFFGRPKSDAADMTHESPPVMWVPLAVLAALAVVGGYIGLYPEPLGGALHHVPHAEGSAHWIIVGTSVVVFLVGVLAGVLFYRLGARDDRLEQDFRPLFRLLTSKLWFDEIYDWYISAVQDRLARLLSFLEHILISVLAVRGSAAVAGALGIFAKGSHTGNLNTYAYWFFAGLAAIWLVVFGF